MIEKMKYKPGCMDRICTTELLRNVPIDPCVFNLTTYSNEKGAVELEAEVEPHMGREAGWNVLFKSHGEKYSFLGIKGVGLTNTGKSRLQSFTLPQTQLQIGMGLPRVKARDLYDFESHHARFLAPRKPGQPVLGFVGEEEVEKDMQLSLQLNSEGFLTSLPVAIVTGDSNDTEVVELNKRGYFSSKQSFFVDEKKEDVFVKDAREVRAFRIPRRLNIFKELLRTNDQERMKEELNYAVNRCNLLGIDLARFGGSNKFENYLIWLYGNAGRQAGVASRINLSKLDLTSLGDVTYALEIVDLGQNTSIRQHLDIESQEYYKETGFSIKAGNANDTYKLYATLPFVIYLTMKQTGLIENNEMDLMALMADSYHRSFKHHYQKKREDWIQLVEANGSDLWIYKEEWFSPNIIPREGAVYPSAYFLLADSLTQNSHLDSPDINVEWPAGRKVKVKHYSSLLAYALSKQWEKEV